MNTAVAQKDPDCPRKVVQFGRERGWAPNQTAKVMHKLCDVSLLAAHRYARGWTFDEVVTELVATAEASGLPTPAVTTELIPHWEAGERPSPTYLDLLCRLFQTRPDQLGFGRDYTLAQEREGSAKMRLPALDDCVTGLLWEGGGRPLQSWRRDLLSGCVSSDGVLNTACLGALDELCRYSRARLDQVPVSAVVLERLEEAALGHAAEFWFTGPSRAVCEMAVDYHRVESLLSDRLSTDLRSRAWLAQARLAGLVGWALVEDGIPTLARDWFHIAASVAREHGDRETRMWAVTLGAFAALAVADWPSADGFAGAALMVAASPSPVTVMAYHAQAEARARLGQPTEALRALQAAELEAVHMDQGHGWYQVTYPWALYWAQRGQILRRLDMTDKAQEALSTGLGAVAPQAHRLRAHLQLDLIACQTIDPDERAEHVRNALAAVPEDQWSARLRDHVGEVRVLMPRPRIPDDDRQEDDEDDGAKKGEVGGVGLSTCC